VGENALAMPAPSTVPPAFSHAPTGSAWLEMWMAAPGPS
jgi:hypothetical protein